MRPRPFRKVSFNPFCVRLFRFLFRQHPHTPKPRSLPSFCVLDVPYGDTFALVNRWEIRPSAEGSGVTCRMGSRLKWLKGLPWGASIIERTVVAGGTEFCQMWRDMAIPYVAEQRQILSERRGARSKARSK